jgi:cytochrome P450
LEEGLRWNCPVIPLSRTPAVPVELGGVHINPGDHIAIILGAANRDETVFENPDEYDIFRKPGPKHVAFGGGAHICIGQHLARLEMTAALNALLDRFPGLRADPDYPPPHVQGFSLRGPHAVHVRFD